MKFIEMGKADEHLGELNLKLGFRYSQLKTYLLIYYIYQ